MKKLTALFLALVLVFAFAACSNNAKNDEANSNTPQAQQSEQTEDSPKAIRYPQAKL